MRTYPCPTCHGSGYCPDCGGDGVIVRGTYDHPIQEQCEYCIGTGDCPDCDGTGETTNPQPTDSIQRTSDAPSKFPMTPLAFAVKRKGNHVEVALEDRR